MSIVEVDPSNVYFTFSRIRPLFSCGRHIETTLEALRSGEMSIESLPPITLLSDGKNLFSLNNRRLYVFKTLRNEGKISTIRARLKMMPKTKRMDAKYTPAKCSLTATIMREGSKKVAFGDAKDGENEDEEEERRSDDEDEGSDDDNNQEQSHQHSSESASKPMIHKPKLLDQDVVAAPSALKTQAPEEPSDDEGDDEKKNPNDAFAVSASQPTATATSISEPTKVDKKKKKKKPNRNEKPPKPALGISGKAKKKKQQRQMKHIQEMNAMDGRGGEGSSSSDSGSDSDSSSDGGKGKINLTKGGGFAALRHL